MKEKICADCMHYVKHYSVRGCMLLDAHCGVCKTPTERVGSVRMTILADNGKKDRPQIMAISLMCCGILSSKLRTLPLF